MQDDSVHALRLRSVARSVQVLEAKSGGASVKSPDSARRLGSVLHFSAVFQAVKLMSNEYNIVPKKCKMRIGIPETKLWGEFMGSKILPLNFCTSAELFIQKCF